MPSVQDRNFAQRRFRRVLAVFFVSALGLAIAGWFYYQHEVAEVRQSNFEELAAIGDLKASQIEAWRTERRRVANRFAHSPTTLRQVANFFRPEGIAEAAEELRARLENECSAGDNEDVLLLSPDGRVLLAARTNFPIANQPAQQRACVVAWQNRDVVFSDFYRLPTKDGCYLDVVKPVNDAAGQPLLLVVYRRDVRRDLIPLMQWWPASIASGETVLLQREGAEVVLVNSLHCATNKPLSLRVPLTETNQMMVRAVFQNDGFLEGQDINGAQVFADVHHITDTEWFLIDKMQCAEGEAENKYRATEILIILGLFIGAGLLTAWYHRRTIQIFSDLLKVETALKVRETMFSTIVNQAVDSIGLVDMSTGRFVEFNEAAHRNLGYTREEFATLRVFDIDAHLAAKEIQQHFEIVNQEGALVTETRHRNKSGELRDVRVSARKISLAGKDYIASLWSDITESKQITERLSASEARSRAIINASPVPMGLNDEHQRITFLNPAFTQTFGYTEADVPTLADWWPKAYPDPAYRQYVMTTWETRMTQAKRSGEPFVPMQVNVCCKDGAVKTVLVSPASLSGLFEGNHLVVLYDITARKKAEDAHAQLATAVEQAAEDILITDTSGKIVYVNPAFEKITGYTAAEVLGKTPRVLKSGKQDNAFYQAMWATLKRGQTWSGRFVNRRKDGTVFEEDATISPIRDTAGKIINYVSVKRDVSREMQLEAQFRQSQKMEAIGQLAGGVAHDFNNLLASILMQVELANMTEDLPSDVRESLQQIGEDGRRAAELTRQLLLFSRRQILQPQVLDLNHVATSLNKMLQRIIGEDVRLELQLNSAPLLTRADAGMLDQVLMNLAVNARDAMVNGGKLRIATLATTVGELVEGMVFLDVSPGDYVGFSVSDSGGGIPPEILPRIFDPFFTTKEPGKGTGLGLATVFGIVKQHQGWIRLDNRPGEGVTFEIFLPATAESGKTITAAAKRKPLGGTETILLVEDAADVRRSLRTMLMRLGYAVIEAENGPTALNLWPSHRESVTLLLTDLVMPGDMSGQDLACQLVASKPDLKIIYMSGYSAELAGRELRLQPREHFIQKPFDPEQFLNLVRESLDEK